MSFCPILRFGVMSDAHYTDELPYRREHFKNAIETMYRYADGQEYRGVDALYVVGDFADTGTTEQMKTFKEDMDKYLRKSTLPVITLANHELHYTDSEEKALTDFDRIFGMKTDRHEVIKGYHFISVTTTRDEGEWHDSFDNAKRNFLKTALKKAAEDTPDKPIFVFQHPGVINTTPGAAFGNLWIYDELAEHKNIIDFSGHSHFAANDPREIHQRDFTSVTTGSTAYLSLGRSWLYKNLGNRGFISKNFAQMLIVEVDDKGLVLVKYIDAERATLIATERLIDLNNFTYLDDRTAPSPTFAANPSTFLKETDGKLYLSFPRASGEVWYYGVKFLNSSGEVLYEENIPADYASAEPKKFFEFTFEEMPDGITSAEIKAAGFFGNISSSIGVKL